MQNIFNKTIFSRRLGKRAEFKKHSLHLSFSLHTSNKLIYCQFLIYCKVKYCGKLQLELRHGRQHLANRFYVHTRVEILGSMQNADVGQKC